MDKQQLMIALASTLNQDKQERTNAETTLKQASTLPGYIATLLDIITLNENSQQAIAIKLAASVSFKNFIRKYWDHENKIQENEKVYIRENITKGIIFCTDKLRSSLLTSFQAIIESDYPNFWPNLLDIILSYFNGPNQALTIPGALYLLETLAKIFRYRPPESEKRSPFEEIINKTFPILLNFLQHLSQSQTIQTAEMQVLIAKIFNSAIQYELPPLLKSNNNLLPWMNLFLKILTCPITEPQPEDLKERSKWPIWHAKKLSASIFAYMFQRYGLPNSSTNQEDKAFAINFLNLYASTLIDALFSVLVTIKSGQFLPGSLICYCLDFFSIAIRLAKTYKIFKPKISQFLIEIIFPLLCFNDEDQQIWDEDPTEFIQREYDSFNDFKNPKNTALDLMNSLLKVRSREHLNEFMVFLSNGLQCYLNEVEQAKQQGRPPAISFAKQKSGLMLAIGSLAPLLKKRYINILEQMLQIHVLFEFSSPYPFLRARACWLFTQFDNILFQNQNIFLQALHSILNLLGDNELPIKIFAAVAIKSLVQLESGSKAIAPHITTLLDQYFKLMDLIDSDELVGALDTILSAFSDQIPPYAVIACEKLVCAFLKMHQEDDEDTNAIAALQCLRAIQTILDAVNKFPEIYINLETVLVPFLQKMINSDAIEYFEDILRIITFLTFYSKSISPALWTLFPLLYNAFEEYATDLIGNILIPMDNYISRGKEQFLSAPQYMEMVFNMFKKLLEDENSSENDCIEACKLIEVALQNCRGCLDFWVPKIIALTANKLKTALTRRLISLLLLVIANCLLYNPILTIQSLESINETTNLFSTWFKNVFTHFKKVYDKKLVVLSLTTLFNLPLTSLPQVIKVNFKALFEALIKLILDIKIQREKESQEKEESESEEESFEDLGDEEDVETQDLLKNEDLFPKGFDNLEDFEDEDEDEEEFISAIDEINEIVYFSQACQEFSQREAGAWQELSSIINEESKSIFSQIVAQAQTLKG
eukprot:TRINITY_DN897_c0_g2_i1.p1 TRINITY_DN897_c0_g2~~TRINITY_DN897_c0_g2_i1.p1  ORF type:complete len:994 (-),score=396.95 TRINITY_DN897_c0_g2_i1:163-3144(-)